MLRIVLLFTLLPLNIYAYSVLKFSPSITPHLSHFTDSPFRFVPGSFFISIDYMYAEGLAKYKYGSPPLNRILPGLNVIEFRGFVECTDWMGVYAGFPITFGNLNSYRDETTGSFSSGDLEYALLFSPFVRSQGGLLLKLGGLIPLGREEYLLRSPLKGGIEVIGGYFPYPMKFLLGAGYYLSESGNLYRVKYGDELKVDGEILFSMKEVMVSAGIKTITFAGNPFKGESTYLEGLFGFGGIFSENYILSLIAGIGFTDSPGTPRYRLGLFITYARRGMVDSDADGIPDKFDLCKFKPEDKDGIQDTDGCPEEDADNDGVPDELDSCPLIAEDENGITDEDGCPELRGSYGVLSLRFKVVIEVDPVSPDRVRVNGIPFRLPGETEGIYVNGKKSITKGKRILVFESYEELQKLSVIAVVKGIPVKIPLEFPEASLKVMRVLDRRVKRTSKGFELKEVEVKLVEIEIYGEEGEFFIEKLPMKKKDGVFYGRTYMEGKKGSVYITGKGKGKIPLFMEIILSE